MAAMSVASVQGRGLDQVPDLALAKVQGLVRGISPAIDWERHRYAAPNPATHIDSQPRLAVAAHHR